MSRIKKSKKNRDKFEIYGIINWRKEGRDIHEQEAG